MGGTDKLLEVLSSKGTLYLKCLTLNRAQSLQEVLPKGIQNTQDCVIITINHSLKIVC